MKTVRDWLNDYSVSHQNPVNKTIHWICVPVITFTVLALSIGARALTARKQS